MIKLLQEGQYELAETKRSVKLLRLDSRHQFAWVSAIDIGEMLVASPRTHKKGCVLSKGAYRVYYVKDESNLADLQHLELYVGLSEWQGYLLPTGVPKKGKICSRIIPTDQLISMASQ